MLPAAESRINTLGAKLASDLQAPSTRTEAQKYYGTRAPFWWGAEGSRSEGYGASLEGLAAGDTSLAHRISSGCMPSSAAGTRPEAGAPALARAVGYKIGFGMNLSRRSLRGYRPGMGAGIEE